jgi:hypothetical protein
MLDGLSRIAFNPDTTEEFEEKAAAIQPILSYMRQEWLETKTISRPHPDGSEEVTFYIHVYTNDVYTLMFKLLAAGIKQQV